MKKIRSWYLPDAETHLVKYIIKDDAYQQAERDHALKFVLDKNVAIDIGAHVGLWAKDLSDKFKTVICFEPIFILFDCLLENTATRNNVTLINLALSNKHDSLYFHYDEKSSGSTHVSSFSSPISSLAVPLDCFHFSSKIDFIKIDCEGWESEIIKGAAKTIKEHSPIINIEQKERRPNSSYIGADTEPFSAIELLLSLGGKQVGQYKSEFVFQM